MPLITSLLLRATCTAYGWYSVRRYTSLLRSAPAANAIRVLAYNRVSRIAPATSAAMPNTMVSGSTTWLAELTPKACIRSAAKRCLKTHSGAARIPRNGSMAPRLTTSAQALTPIRPVRKANCRRRLRLRCGHSRSSECKNASLLFIQPTRFAAQLLDLGAQFLVLAYLPAQEVHGNFGLFLYSAGRQEVHVGHLVAAVLEVDGLDPTPGYQRAQAVVDLPEADTELARYIALAHFGIGL